ncbi:MAG TPA: hypothetical protein VF503_15075 [Sphingobium sp.]|uniref:hypothetical protein n=1 Tax=Sphingobium sp. TaxID=1912891 RepID=UPI002ED0AEA1
MADRVSASITLGGSISIGAFAELVAIIANEGLSTEWDGEAFEPHHRTIGAPLSLYAHEVAWGYFNELESWCARNQIAFARWSGGYGGQWGPERVIHTGDGELTSYAVTEDDVAVIAREAIEQLGSYAAVLDRFSAADFTVPPLIVEGDPTPQEATGETSPPAEEATNVE